LETTNRKGNIAECNTEIEIIFSSFRGEHGTDKEILKSIEAQKARDQLS
jgi:hypothetical protein